MIYSFTLQQVGWITGVVLVLVHFIALWKPVPTRSFLQSFPRSRMAGILLLILAALWSFLLVWNMDLGEFSRMRHLLLLAIVILSIATGILVPEFLSVRALGILLLLAAEPLLEAAFLKPTASRIFLVLIAYAWAIKGIFWVGMPFLFRDLAQWLINRPRVWSLAAAIGLAYGCLLILCSILFY